MRTRVAPTPSGYLHVGNAVNALLVSWLAEQGDGEVALRIDDMDSARYRREYVDDALDLLAWLGVTWTLGPRSTDEFETRHSQRLRTSYYRSELDAAVRSGLPAFACTCSRAQSRAAGTSGCAGDCPARGATVVPGESALRVRLPDHGDVVLWRRDDLPAYHLVSLLEDRDLAITHIVRGEDLRESTEIQRALAPWFRADTFTAAVVLHHPLLTGPDGAKLSKSQLAAGPLPRTAGVRDEVRGIAVHLGAPLGVVAPRHA